MRLYNPTASMGGEIVEFKKNNQIKQIQLGTFFNLAETDGERLLILYPFLKHVDNPMHSPDYYETIEKKPNWFKRLFRYG